jgi:hypothetical protein
VLGMRPLVILLSGLWGCTPIGVQLTELSAQKKYAQVVTEGYAYLDDFLHPKKEREAVCKQIIAASWTSAAEQNTPSGYAQFRRVTERCEPSKEAVAKSLEMEALVVYQGVSARADVAAHQGFRKTYPESSVIQDSLLAESELAFNEAKRGKSLEALHRFQTSYCQLSHAAVCERVVPTAWALTRTARRVEAYRLFQTLFPQSRQSMQAKVQEAEAVFEALLNERNIAGLRRLEKAWKRYQDVVVSADLLAKLRQFEVDVSYQLATQEGAKAQALGVWFERYKSWEEAVQRLPATRVRLVKQAYEHAVNSRGVFPLQHFLANEGMWPEAKTEANEIRDRLAHRIMHGAFTGSVSSGEDMRRAFSELVQDPAVRASLMVDMYKLVRAKEHLSTWDLFIDLYKGDPGARKFVKKAKVARKKLAARPSPQNDAVIIDNIMQPFTALQLTSCTQMTERQKERRTRLIKKAFKKMKRSWVGKRIQLAGCLVMDE